MLLGIRLAVLIAVAASGLGATSVDAANVYEIGFSLTDDAGQRVRLSDWKGRPSIVTMEYANCRFICSITLQRLLDVQNAADRQKKSFQFLIFSIDPKNDTPAEWTLYRKMRGLDRGNWHFMTASVAETPGLARTLGVHYWLYDEHIMHDFRLLRVDSNGNIVKVMEAFDANIDEFIR
ncbi:MAG: SCO family protein [Proteobacteria bacterium]|nr:SCO family protein [Pseudomonadota bacterium]